MSKYKTLWDYVQKKGDMPLKLTFDEIKDITGAEIDHSFPKWTIPTYILYGEKDNLTSYKTMSELANKVNASAVMKGGEHWFHTEEQMKFFD